MDYHPKIVDYRIVEARDATKLEAQVRSLVAQGWCPKGGVCVFTPANLNERFYQAMCRYEEQK